MDFVKAQRKYGLCIAQYKAGTISTFELEKEVSQLEVLDQYGNRWQLGVRSGKWYRFDGSAWIEDLPPLPPDVVPVDISSQATGKFPKRIVRKRPPQGYSPPQPALWHIIIESGASAGQRIPINQTLVIGRDRNANVHLDDPQASRRHALIQKSGQEYLLIDQNSANGTELNGKLVHQPTSLKHGDRIKLGDTQIQIEGGLPSAPVTMISYKPAEVLSAPTPPQPVYPPPSQISPPPPPLSRSVYAPKPKKRKGCTCFIIGLLSILAIIACLVALAFGGVIMFPDILTLLMDFLIGIGLLT